MSATEGQNGSGPELGTLRASLRCGRSLPVRHLVESDEVFMQRRRRRDPTALCGTDVAAPDLDAEDPDCPGCQDCLRYCPGYAREAHRFRAKTTPAGNEPELEPVGRVVGECGHSRVINYRGLLGPCPCDTDTGAALPGPALAAPGGGLKPAS